MKFKTIKKYIYVIVLILFSVGVISCLANSNSHPANNLSLFPVWNKNNQLSFIDEKGNTIVKFKPNEFDYVGDFFEDKVFLAKKRKFLQNIGLFDYILAKLYIMNNKGEIIAKIPFDCVIGINLDLGEDEIPEFYNNEAVLNLPQNKTLTVKYFPDKIVYTENNKTRNNSLDINNAYILSNQEQIKNLQGLRPNSKYKMDEGGPFPYYTKQGDDGCNCSLGCINYLDKNGKTVIKLNTCNPSGSGDYTIDPYFYNGVAMVFGEIPNPTRRFINKKGEYINNETYLIAIPFWRNLASFVTSDNEFGYINTDGLRIKYNKE